MALHRLTSITVGVPDVAATSGYYRDFGLEPIGTTPEGTVRFGTRDGGEQLRITHAPRRRLLGIGVGAHDRDDLGRVQARLARLDVPSTIDADRLSVSVPNSEIDITVEVAAELVEEPGAAAPTNGPGRPDRPNGRAPGVEREGQVRPRKLGHLVIGSVDQEATQRFFVDGLGFKISDEVKGAAGFLRCSTDHHNAWCSGRR
jgi:catechol 2,3-dioxygenase-like lactoylglutathione lyase family enzyme